MHPHDLNTRGANVIPQLKLEAAHARQYAADIRARGPRRTAGPVHPDVAAQHLQDVEDAAGPHELKAARHDQRVAALSEGILLHHGNDPEAVAFNQEHRELFADMAQAKRVHYIRPGHEDLSNVPGLSIHDK